jgi:transcriptional/translational regulatory protein YebC/TACO1
MSPALNGVHSIACLPRRSVLKLMEMLDDHDDVQKVASNFNIPDEAMAEIESS